MPTPRRSAAWNLFDLAPGGERVVVSIPVETTEGQEAQNHLTFLLNFIDEVRCRAATLAKWSA
jgi:hypothetical protein